MTSEVALLNKSGIALAADSAMTVKYWENGEWKKRYSKGAEKIIPLSRVHPVALMTYGTANVEGTPWDLIAQMYRDEVQPKAHDELPGYAEDFFNFLAGNARLLQPPEGASYLGILAGHTAYTIANEILDDESFAEVEGKKLRTAVFWQLLEEQKAYILNSPWVAGADQTDADAALRQFKDDVQAMIREKSYFREVPDDVIPHLAGLGIMGVYKRASTPLSTTGLVFAGFGEKEYFPRLCQYECHGSVLGKLLYKLHDDFAIAPGSEAALVPLAQSEMIKTFMLGMGGDSAGHVSASFTTHILELLESLRKEGHLSQSVELHSWVEAASKRHINDLFDRFENLNHQPLRRIIDTLSFAEMAELAESLVFMESLKERVTMPTESVSGPIDVAVISKSDGFVWIKKKQYFDRKLNPDFLRRHYHTSP